VAIWVVNGSKSGRNTEFCVKLSLFDVVRYKFWQIQEAGHKGSSISKQPCLAAIRQKRYCSYVSFTKKSTAIWIFWIFHKIGLCSCGFSGVPGEGVIFELGQNPLAYIENGSISSLEKSYEQFGW